MSRKYLPTVYLCFISWRKSKKSGRSYENLLFLELRRGGLIKEVLSSKNQCPNTFLKFPKETQKTWWKLWKSQVLQLKRGGPTREASNFRKQLIYTLIMPHIQKKGQETWWKLLNSHISSDSSLGWWASTFVPETIFSAAKFPIIFVISIFSVSVVFLEIYSKNLSGTPIWPLFCPHLPNHQSDLAQIGTVAHI